MTTLLAVLLAAQGVMCVLVIEWQRKKILRLERFVKEDEELLKKACDVMQRATAESIPKDSEDWWKS